MKIIYFILLFLLFASCSNTDSEISPENDFITNIYTSKYNWDSELYSIAKNLLFISSKNHFQNLTKEEINSNIPSNLNTRVMRVEIGIMTKKMSIDHAEFYYVNTDMIYIRDGESYYIGFAYIFTEKNDNSIYYCKILMK